MKKKFIYKRIANKVQKIEADERFNPIIKLTKKEFDSLDKKLAEPVNVEVVEKIKEIVEDKPKKKRKKRTKKVK